jgi:sec-independent protein translocase protein TatB
MTSLRKDVTDALRIDGIDKPAAAIEPPAAAAPEAVAPTEPLAVAAPNELKDAKAS